MTERDDRPADIGGTGDTRLGAAFAATVGALPEPGTARPSSGLVSSAFAPTEGRRWSTVALTLAWSLWGVSVALSIISFWVFFGELEAVAMYAPGADINAEGSDFLAALVAVVRWEHFLDVRRLLTFVVGMGMSGFVVWYRPRDAMALLFAAFAASIAASPISGYLVWIGQDLLNTSSWGGVVLANYTCLLFCAYGVLALFPSGRFLPGLRWLALLLWWIGTFNVLLRWWLWPRSGVLSFAVLLAIALGLTATQVWRYLRHATVVERLQLKWFLVGAVVYLPTQLVMVGLVRPLILSSSAPVAVLATISFEVVLLAATVLIFTLFMFGVVRHRLWDVDVVINRSLVYGGLLLALFFVLVFAFVVFGLVFQAVLGTYGQLWALLVGAVLAALSFKPALAWLKRSVDDKLYGIRVDYAALPRARGVADTPAHTTSSLAADVRPTFGDYMDLAPIGRGGMGHVYRATHASSGDTVALKILREHLCDDDETMRRFFREEEITKRLSHPGIISVRSRGVIDGVPYLVMPLVEGTDLATLLRERGRLTLAEAMLLLRGVAAALDYAHAAGVVHRDVKPSNILLATPDNRPVLTDFGIAWIDASTTRLTRQGAVLGTLDYISPEQIHGEVEISGSSDVYALGVTAFEMITGRRPFVEQSAMRLAMAHLVRPPPDPRTHVPELPRSVARALGRALQKQPQDRYATSGEFIDALAR